MQWLVKIMMIYKRLWFWPITKFIMHIYEQCLKANDVEVNSSMGWTHFQLHSEEEDVWASVMIHFSSFHRFRMVEAHWYRTYIYFLSFFHQHHHSTYGNEYGRATTRTKFYRKKAHIIHPWMCMCNLCAK